MQTKIDNRNQQPKEENHNLEEIKINEKHLTQEYDLANNLNEKACDSKKRLILDQNDNTSKDVKDDLKVSEISIINVEDFSKKNFIENPTDYKITANKNFHGKNLISKINDSTQKIANFSSENIIKVQNFSNKKIDYYKVATSKINENGLEKDKSIYHEIKIQEILSKYKEKGNLDNNSKDEIFYKQELPEYKINFDLYIEKADEIINKKENANYPQNNNINEQSKDEEIKKIGVCEKLNDLKIQFFSSNLNELQYKYNTYYKSIPEYQLLSFKIKKELKDYFFRKQL